MFFQLHNDDLLASRHRRNRFCLRALTRQPPSIGNCRISVRPQSLVPSLAPRTFLGSARMRRHRLICCQIVPGRLSAAAVSSHSGGRSTKAGMFGCERTWRSHHLLSPAGDDNTCLRVPEDLNEEDTETYMVCAQTRTLFTSTAHEILAQTRGIVSIYVR